MYYIRLTRNVVATELHTLVLCFELVLVIREMIVGILGKHVPIEAYIYSKTFFEVFPKDAKRTQ